MPPTYCCIEIDDLEDEVGARKERRKGMDIEADDPRQKIVEILRRRTRAEAGTVHSLEMDAASTKRFNEKAPRPARDVDDGFGSETFALRLPVRKVKHELDQRVRGIEPA